MSVRAGRMQDASLPNTSSQQRSDVADLPPPYKVRENPAAALARRVARPPNASVEVYNTEAHRGSRRSLDQRVFQSNSGVIRLGCALLLLGLLVSCTAFALALVSFSANDTQHLQQQLDALRAELEASEASNSDSSESLTVAQDIQDAIHPVKQKLARDSSQIMELSRSYDSLGIGMMRMNESLLLLQESVGNQQTSVEMVEDLQKQLKKRTSRIQALERQNNGLKELMQRMRGEMERYHVSVSAQLTAFSLQLPVDCSPICSFTHFQSIDTDGAYDIESFQINKQYYLAVANYGNISKGRQIANSMIYKFNGHSFEVYQPLQTYGAHNVKQFDVNQRHFLAIGHQGDNNTTSLIYEWNSTHFTPFQRIQTRQACDIEAFEISGHHFTAIANHCNGETHDIGVSVLAWDGKKFGSFQQLEAVGAHAIKYFMIDGESFLAIACSSEHQHYVRNSKIYRWNGQMFVLHHNVSTGRAWHVQAFQFKKRYFLMFACYQDSQNQETISLLLRWDKKQRVFVEYQRVETPGVRHIDHVTFNDEHLLFATGYQLGNSSNVNSTLFRWVNQRFVVEQILPMKGSTALRPFKLGTNLFLAAMQSFNGRTSTVASDIYRYQ